MFDAAERGELGALYVVGANPVARYSIDPAALQNTFVVVQDMFLTETAQLADVILPAANLYEKAGTVTNTYGDLQLVKKAADRAGVRPTSSSSSASPTAWAPTSHQLVPFGTRPCAPTSASPAARNPAKRTATPSGSPPISSSRRSAPSIPSPILDEIAAPRARLRRRAPRICSPATISIRAEARFRFKAAPAPRRDLVLPADDTLFTSGTLGRYSAKPCTQFTNRTANPRRQQRINCNTGSNDFWKESP